MADGSIAVAVLYSPAAREVQEWQLTLPRGATVLEALRASGFAPSPPAEEPAQGPIGIWGRPAQLDHVLAEGDRVEIYRPLRIDPKVARRERFRKQGARAAGLFARRKEGKGAGA